MKLLVKRSTSTGAAGVAASTLRANTTTSGYVAAPLLGGRGSMLDTTNSNRRLSMLKRLRLRHNTIRSHLSHHSRPILWLLLLVPPTNTQLTHFEKLEIFSILLKATNTHTHTEQFTTTSHCCKWNRLDSRW